MFPNQTKNPLFNNLAGGWKNPKVMPAPKMPGIDPNMPKNLPGISGMADGLPSPTAGAAPMPAPTQPMQGMQGAPAMHIPSPLPPNPMMKKSPWMGMKAI